MNLKEALLKNKNKAFNFDFMTFFKQDEVLNEVANALNNGYKIIHYYIKTVSDKENVETAFKLRQLCSIYEALLIINSRVDIAKLVDADGVCLFENDISATQARELLHNDEKIISIYASSKDNILIAQDKNIDYIAINENDYNQIKSNIKKLNKIKYIELNRVKL